MAEIAEPTLGSLSTQLEAQVQLAAEFIRQGKLVAMPTETVYGLAADAKNEKAVQKIFEVKGRPATNPLIVHLADLSHILEWVTLMPETAVILAKRFWPGALTLVLPKHPSVPDIVTGGQQTIAIRIPNHPLALALLQAVDTGLAAPSANRYGHISPTLAQHVEADLGTRIDYILDGGACDIGIESTIVSCVSDIPVILREGSITRAEIAETLGLSVTALKASDPVIDPADLSSTLKMPGSDHSHYAPSKPLYLLDTNLILEKLPLLIEQKAQLGLLCISTSITRYCTDNFLKHFNFIWASMPCDPKEYARTLYEKLRSLDQTDAEILLIETPPQTSEWAAIHDRLWRASQKKSLF